MDAGASDPRAFLDFPEWLRDILREVRKHAKPPPAPPPVPTLAPGELLRITQRLLAEKRINTTDTLEIITLLLTGAWRAPNLPALRALAGKDAAQVGVCGTVWKHDELAYKCKTCERDPTCAICVSCFRHGDHRGHDFAMIRTGGGCCDCGDVQAWQPSGFCSHHKGASGEDEDPAASMDPRLRSSLVEVAEAVSHEIYKYCRKFHNAMREEAAKQETRDADRRNERICSLEEIKHVVACVMWMHEVLKCGDGVRRVIGVHLAKPMDSSWLFHMLRLDGVERLPPRILQTMHTLYFQLITDLVFKRVFLEIFILNYPRFIHAVVLRNRKGIRGSAEDFEQRKDDIMEQFSVQLFTVPALIPVMMRDGGLLDILVDMTLHLMETAAVPVLPHLNVDLGESHFENKRENVAKDDEESMLLEKRYPFGFLPTPKWIFEPESTSGTEPSSDSPHFLRGGSSAGISASNFGFSEVFGERPSPAADPELPIPVVPRRRVLRPRRANRGSNLGAIFTRIPQALAGNSQAARAGTGNPSVVPGSSTEACRTRSSSRRGASQSASNVLLEELRSNIVEGQSVSLREAERLNRGTRGLRRKENLKLNRSFLEGITKVRSAAAEADTKDRDRLTPETKRMILQRELLQRTMFEDGVEDLDVFHCEEPQLASQSFGKWYRDAVLDARERSKAAAANNGNLAHTMRIEWFQSNIMQNAVGRVIFDLRYVFNHAEIALHFVHHRPDLFRKFVRILSMMQAIFPVRRHFGEHVHVEAETWSKAFTLEIEMYLLVQYIVVAFCKYPNPKMPADAGPDVETCRNEVRKRGGKVHLTAPESRARLLGFVRQALSEWIKREEVIESMSIMNGERFSVAHTVSVHLPLHRLLSMLAHHVVRLDGTSLSFALSGSDVETTPDEAMEIMRHPLRIHAFLAQVRAGMWRRNGRVVQGQAMLYRSIVCVEWFVDMDVFLMQMCSIIAGEQRLISEVLSTYEMHSFTDFVRLPESLKALNETSAFLQAPRLVTTIPVAKADIESVLEGISIPPYAQTYLKGLANVEWVRTSLGENAFFGTYRANLTLAEYAPAIVEDIFSFFVYLSTERSRCGFDTRSYLRRRLLHMLACQDYTHSLLLRFSPRYSQQPHPDEPTDTSPLGTDKVDATIAAMVDTILAEISDFEQPHGMEQGRYRLKDTVWPEFDRFAPQVSVRDRGTAEERYLAATKRINTKPLPFRSTPIDKLPLYPQFLKLKRIASHLCSIEYGGIARVILEKFVQDKAGPHSLDGSVVGALYFACMAVEFAPALDSMPESPDPESIFHTNWLSQQMLSSTWNKPTCLDLIAEIYRLCLDSAAGPGQEIQYGLERVLREAHARGDSQLRERLTGKVPLLFASSSSRGSGQDGEKDDVTMSQRQRRIREMKKKKQAEAMAQMLASQERFEKLIDHDAEDEIVASPASKADRDASNSMKMDDTEADSQEVSREAKATAEAQTCALCREEASEDGGYMGLVGFLQATTVPCIARKHRAEPGKYMNANYGGKGSRRTSSADPPQRNPVLDLANEGGEPEQEEGNPGGVERNWRAFFNPQDGGNAVGQALNLIAGHGVPPNMGADVNVDNNYGSHLMDVDDARNRVSRNEEDMRRRYLDWNNLKDGGDEIDGVHIGFCGHAIHSKCFQRYFKRLEQSNNDNERYEGEHVVELDRGEFLCPFCRRLANFLLPVSKDVPVPKWNLHKASSSGEKNDIFESWLRDASSMAESASESRSGESDAVMQEISQESSGMSSSVMGVTSSHASHDSLRTSGLSSGSHSTASQERRVRFEANKYDPGPSNIVRIGAHEVKVLKRLAEGTQQFDLDSEHEVVLSQAAVVSSISVIMFSTITTVICAEIGCRSGAWAGAESEIERRLLGTFIREARAQASSFPEYRNHHRARIWKVVLNPRQEVDEFMDAFCCFVFLILLWDEEFTMADVHGVVRLCYRLSIFQAASLVKKLGYTTSVAADVNCEVLLFLRRVAVFCSCLFNVNIKVEKYAKDHKVTKESIDQELCAMLEKLELVPLDVAVPFLQDTLLQIPDKCMTTAPNTTKIFSPERFGLLTLPDVFQDLLENLEVLPCDKCGTKPHKPVLCLACGALFCYSKSHSKPLCPGKEEHAKSCGRGVGVFMVLKQTSVVVMRQRRKSRWGSPYLDQHGEEDHELHRGKPLYLSTERYEGLDKLWLSHRFDNDFRILNSHFLEGPEPI